MGMGDGGGGAIISEYRAIFSSDIRWRMVFKYRVSLSVVFMRELTVVVIIFEILAFFVNIVN